MTDLYYIDDVGGISQVANDAPFADAVTPSALIALERLPRATCGSSLSSVFSAPAANRTVQAKARLQVRHGHRAPRPFAEGLDGLVIDGFLQPVCDQPLYEAIYANALTSSSCAQGSDERRIDFD